MWPVKRLYGALGLVGTVVAWWVLAETVFADVGVAPNGQGGTIPNPAEVVGAIVEVGPAYLYRHISVTGLEALLGFAWGVGLALVLASVVVLAPRLEGFITLIATVSYCIPVVAIGPIVRIVAGSPKPGEPSVTAVFLSAMLVVFTTVIGTLVGLRAADTASLDLIRVYGGGRWKQFVLVRSIAALPGVLNALKIAAPLAFLGAIIGEYMGGVDVGIGPALVNAQQTLQAPRAWAIALVTGICSGMGFVVIAIISRFVTPWTRGTSRSEA
ncbi:ABC transporter permease subunit [Georgenia yuyongxinii]|uniref:ABC transporter permease subunit n=2 Tax=Georgenia yuyongxinii TaxID=2589797 RepID=A0A552WY22_9MICO|nr:ABC transporter permease subunit [Georgenia yuyongxinii]